MIYAAVLGAAYGCNKEAHTCPPIPGCTGMIDLIDGYRITAWEVTLDGSPLEISDGRITVRDDSNGMMNAVTLLCEAVRNGRKYVFDTGSFEVGGDDYDVRLYVYSSRASLSVYGAEKYSRLGIAGDGFIRTEYDASAPPEQRPAFDCDIAAQCTLDGRELYFRITGIAPRYRRQPEKSRTNRLPPPLQRIAPIVPVPLRYHPALAAR